MYELKQNQTNQTKSELQNIFLEKTPDTLALQGAADIIT